MRNIHGKHAAMITLLGFSAATAPLLGCASPAKSEASLPPAPALDSLADAPIVTAQPTIKRTDPIKAIKALSKGDDIEIKPPVPVLSATMPESASE